VHNVITFWSNNFTIIACYDALVNIWKFVLRCKKFYNIGPLNPFCNFNMILKLLTYKQDKITLYGYDLINFRLDTLARYSGYEYESGIQIISCPKTTWIPGKTVCY
jgi:hypothetical protein